MAIVTVIIATAITTKTGATALIGGAINGATLWLVGSRHLWGCPRGQPHIFRQRQRCRKHAPARPSKDRFDVETEGVLLDESLLTGESVPVEKERGGAVFSGTLVVRGIGMQISFSAKKCLRSSNGGGAMVWSSCP